MAMTDAEIKVVIAAELKKQGFDKAAKATTGLEKTFNKLGKTIVSVFAVRQVIRFAQASVNAFAQAEKEAAALRSQLTGINLAFATPVVDDYIDKLELATGLTGDQLVPAFNALSRATEDITTAQELLNLALDISFATGKDLGSVSGALQRAYKGEVTALGRLRLGLTNAELKGKKFEKVIKELERRFGGSTERATQTYGSTVDRLKRSIEQAQESIGEGFVSGLKKSGKSIEDFQGDIKDLGFALGEAAGAFSNFIASTSNDIDKFLNSSAYLKFRDAIDFLFRQANFVVTGEMLVKNTPAMQAGNQRRSAEIAARNELRARNAILQQEKKNAAARKKIETEEEKRRRLLAAQKRAQTIFDMENIQIVAALQGKIDGEQRARLVALLALNTENYVAAEKLADVIIRINEPALANLGVMIQAGDTIDEVVKKLITSQAKLAALQLTAEDFPELDNPFDEWNDTLDEILAKLLAILEMSMGGQKKAGAVDYSVLNRPALLLSGQRYQKMLDSIMGGNNPWDMAANAPIDYSQTSIMSSANQLAAQRYAAMQQNVNVYVSGNVVTEQDLVSSITESLYAQQKSGQQVVYSSTKL